MAQHNIDGHIAEQLECDYLKSQKYKIVERNYRNRYCEIDIIAARKSELVFVEVKYRRSDSHGGPLGAVGYYKAQQLEFGAQLWLSEHPRYDVYGKRIDVIAITGPIENPSIQQIENAVGTNI